MALQLPFLKPKKKEEIPIETPVEQIRKKDPDAARLAEAGFIEPKVEKGIVKDWKGQEEFEKFQHRKVKTDFPDPVRRFRLVLEYPNFNIENTYYWFLTFFNESWGFERMEKAIDTLASSVASSLFGNLQTRLAAQQANASQYLKGVSEMIKGLFQIVA